MDFKKKCTIVGISLLASLSLAACGNTQCHNRSAQGARQEREKSKQPSTQQHYVNELVAKNAKYVTSGKYDASEQKVVLTLKPNIQQSFMKCIEDAKKNGPSINPRPSAADKQISRFSRKLDQRIQNQVEKISERQDGSNSTKGQISSASFANLPYKYSQGIPKTIFSDGAED